MDSNRFDVYFSFLYIFIVLCFILPPREFVSAGLTIQNIFASYLGSKDVDFVGYHLKRTTLTLAIHSCFPLLYYFGLGISAPHNGLFTISQLTSLQMLLALFCFGSFIVGMLLSLFWRFSNWRFHPLAKDLLRYGSPWRGVASQINLEYRRIEKFSSVTGGTSVYVTDSWIVKCSTYRVYIAQQTDSHLSVVKSEEFLYNQDTNQSAQFLKINVSTIPPHKQTFGLNLNSLEYNDLKDRLSAPIRTVQNVVVHQTLSDRFLETFKQQVEINGSVEIPSLAINDIENCIGCMSKRANIKLLKRCASLSEGECGQCYCRPMWCLECMGKWYASRQNQHEPEGWMASRAHCPTCRTIFCMLDVFRIS